MLCCFRRHTVAYVSSSCRLYTFGLGGNGQLGIGSKTSSLTPILVPSISSVAGATNSAVTLVSAYAGGDQCIALMAKVCRHSVLASEVFTLDILSFFIYHVIFLVKCACALGSICRIPLLFLFVCCTVDVIGL